MFNFFRIGRGVSCCHTDEQEETGGNKSFSGQKNQFSLKAATNKNWGISTSNKELSFFFSKR